jgi:hypothetical protein
MFEKIMLRRIAERKEQEEGEKPRSEEHHYSYSSADIFIVMKSKNMTLVGHVACIYGGEKCMQNFIGKV